MAHPTIDPDFEKMLPALTEYEAEQLEASIVADGCRDALVVWRGFLVDGHNRLRICQKHDLSYSTTEIELETREEVFDWIDKNQLSRRNLAPEQAKMVRGRILNRAKMPHGGDRKSAESESKPQNESLKKPGKTAARLAPELGVSRATLERDGKFAEDVETIAEVVPEIMEQVARGTSPTAKDVTRAAKAIRDGKPEVAVEIVKKKPHVAKNTGVNEWYTPAEIIEKARVVLGSIDTDPASCEQANEVVKAGTFHTAEDSGLVVSWLGNVWLNPPYSQPLIGKFCEKLIAEIDSGDAKQAITLTNNGTETAWGQSLLVRCSAVCFPAKRIRFNDPSGEPGAPLQGQMLCYFGDTPGLFADEFRDMGAVFHV